MGREQEVRYVGIDVSARSLSYTFSDGAGEVHRGELKNLASDRVPFLKRITKGVAKALVVVESTGVYGLDLALECHEFEKVQITVLNPRAAKDFAGACMKRSKSDRIDPDVLHEYAMRMALLPWTPPPEEAIGLRNLARRAAAMVQFISAEKARLHANSYVGSRYINNDILVIIRFHERRLAMIREAALEIIEGNTELSRKYEQLISITGVGMKSAISLLAEISVLPPGLTPRQLAAHAGLDPRTFESGSSVRKKPRISKVGNHRLRAALYMPAQVAARHNPNVRAYHQRLMGRGKLYGQSITAIMRKLLHVIVGMTANDETFDATKAFPIIEPIARPA